MDFVTLFYIMKRHAIFILLFFALPALCHAESAYVSDVLRVGVRDVPDNTQPAHGVVVSGMKLEVLERSGGYIKIRTDKGVQGWIRETYVTNKIPAVLELDDLQTKQATLRAKLAEQDKLLKSETEKVTSLEAELAKLKTLNQHLKSTNSSVNSALADTKAVGYLLYAIWIIMFVVMGFVAGYLWHRRQAMKQFGGLQI